MDVMDVIVWLIIGSLVLGVIVALLRADAKRVQQQREQKRQAVDAARRASLPPPDTNHHVIVQRSQNPVSAPRSHNPSVARNPRIKFGQVRPGPVDPPPTPIRIGAVQTNQLKCPFCNRSIEPASAVMECTQCHTRYHTPCWSEFTRERSRPCPTCQSVDVKKLSL